MNWPVFAANVVALYVFIASTIAMCSYDRDRRTRIDWRLALGVPLVIGGVLGLAFAAGSLTFWLLR